MYVHFTMNRLETCLRRTAMVTNILFSLGRCPLYRGHVYDTRQCKFKAKNLCPLERGVRFSACPL